MSTSHRDGRGPGAGAAEQVAAVDLGSNSFHLAVARVHGDELSMLDRVRDQVQLARGLGKRNQITKRVRARALSCLRRFNQRLRYLPVDRVRAVGTSTLRKASDASAFLAEAEDALGHRIEVISGSEEARLIYLGVSHSLADEPGARLVIDIGGGSTECILGEHFDALEVHSLDAGCVRLSKRFFPEGEITRAALDAATLRAGSEIQRIERRFKETGWTRAIGASGTIRTAVNIARLNGWNPGPLTPDGLKMLRKAVLAAEHTSRLKLKGLKSERRAVFPGGLAVLLALFDRLEIESLTASSGALREGVMYDLLGRIRKEDVRERTIRSFQERHRVDVAQAARVERMVLSLLSHAPAAWAMDAAEDGRFLAWGARLHEIGLAVSWNGYHRHSGYLLAHADMPGFSRADQELLAVVVACHRRKIDLAVLDHLSERAWLRATRLILLLRLAVLLHRGRHPEPLPPFRLSSDEREVRLEARARWLKTHPLTVVDLERERGYLKSVDFDFALAR